MLHYQLIIVLILIKATQFRIWATSILKDYLMKGYAINEKRLEVLNKTIEIQSKMIAHSLSIDVDEINFVIKSYTNALSLNNIIEDLFIISCFYLFKYL